MITVTNSALDQFRKILGENGADGQGIRIYAAGGVWGPTLAMVIANEARTEDEVLDYGDLSVFVLKVVVSWLGESSIDFTEGGGFTVSGMPQPSRC